MKEQHGTVEAVAKHLYDKTKTDLRIVVGPLVWEPADGMQSKVWYFTVATGPRRKGKMFVLDRVQLEGMRELDAALIRTMLVARLREFNTKRSIHTIDRDETKMTELCAAFWLSDMSARLHKLVSVDLKNAAPTS